MGASFDPGLIVDSIINVLQAGMPAKLDALDTLYGDGVLTGEDINKWYRSRMGMYDAHPCQTVFPFGPAIIVDEEAGFTSWAHPITIVTLDVASIETATVDGDALLPVEVMQVRLGRYARATVELLDANRTLTVAGTKNGKGSILEIGGPNYLDFEYSIGDPALMRRNVAIPIAVAVQ